MPKSRHRAPSACLRQWIVWAVTAFAAATAFASVSLLSGGPAPVAWTFLLLLLCFATGSLANSIFLSRPLRRAGHIVFPAVREPAAIEGPAVEPEPTRPPAAGRARVARAGADEPAFASSSEIDGRLGVTVLISGNAGTDPAHAETTGVGLADFAEGYVVEGIPVQKTGAEVTQIESETVAATAEFGPYPGSVRAKANGQSPDSGFRVKGNARSKRYHTMQSPYYERTKATVWFRSTADAERAGFSAWNSRTKNSV